MNDSDTITEVSEKIIPKSSMRVRNNSLEIIVDEESPYLEVPKTVLNKLTAYGYTLLERLDKDDDTKESEGHTSIINLSNFTSGDISKRRVVKIPLSWIDASSITTLINLSKRNVYQNEVEYAQYFSNELAHENIIDIVDHLKIDGYDIIVENYIPKSKSLKSMLKWNTPNDDKLKDIYNKILNGFEHMHNHGVIYRDGKSSNILVTDDGLVKIIDLQNCAREGQKCSSTVQSKGGTAYTKPKIINAVMKGDVINPSRDMDLYSINVIGYEMVTGRVPFDYKLEKAEPEEGKELILNGKKYYVKLLRNDKCVDEITDDMFKEDVKKALKSLKGREKRFYKMFEKGFLGRRPSIFSKKQERKYYNSVDEIREDFNKVMKSPFNKVKDIIYSSLKPAIITSAAIATIGGMIIMGKAVDDRTPPKPTLSEIMRTSDYRSFGLEDLKEPEFSFMWSTLKPDIKGLQEKINKLEVSKDEYYNRWIPSFADFSKNVHQIPKRLYSSLCRAAFIADTTKLDSSYVKERYWPTLVPKDFIVHNNSIYSDPRSNPDDREKMAHTAMYVKLNMGYGKDIAEVFANYFCSTEELATAKINSKSWKYFARVDESHTILPGYVKYLSSEKRRIINNAVILYQITDDDGVIDWNKLPTLVPNLISNSDTYNGYTAFPTIIDSIVKK